MSRGIGRVAATMAVVLTGMAVGPGIAGADRGPRFGHDHRWRHHHHVHVRGLTVEQRQCLADQARVSRPGASRNPVAHWVAWRAAFKACGITFPPGKPPVSTTTTSTTTTSTTTTTTTTTPPNEPN